MTGNSEIILEADQISLRDDWGFNSILKNISLQIKQRDRAVIIGASGAGKTSLLRLLNRLVEPTTGTLYFQKTPYWEIPVITLRQQVVLVPQEPKLLGMTVAETLAYPLQLQHQSQSEINQRLTTYTEKLKIPASWFDKTELQLSFGQRQLVTIARGLMMQPSVLLLDEPTSGLDIATANHLINVLKQEALTIIMVNHQLDVAETFSDRVLYLKQGELSQNISNQNLDWQNLKQEILETEAELEAEWN